MIGSIRMSPCMVPGASSSAITRVAPPIEWPTPNLGPFEGELRMTSRAARAVSHQSKGVAGASDPP